MENPSGPVLILAVIVVVVGSAAGVLLLDRPRVTGVDNEWGEVTSERTEVRTRVTVTNPTLLRIGDAVVDLEYTVRMNDVTVARGQKRDVDLPDGDHTIRESTWVKNDRLPDWWVSHVRNDETTTVTVQPDIQVEVVGIELPAHSMTRTRTVRTDLLEPLQSTRDREFRAFDRTVLVVEETDAQWGTVTDAETPIEATATVTNPTGVPIPLTEVTYTVHMNDVVIGNGSAASPGVIDPGTTKTIATTAVVDNSRLDEWWVSHRERNGTTTMSVEFTAVLDLPGGERRIPLDFLSFERTFETNLFGDDGSASDASAVDRAHDSDGATGRSIETPTW